MSGRLPGQSQISMRIDWHVTQDHAEYDQSTQARQTVIQSTEMQQITRPWSYGQEQINDLEGKLGNERTDW